MDADSGKVVVEYRRLAFGVYLPGFLRVFGGGICATYVPLYVAEQGGSNVVVGLVLGAQAAGLLAADLPAGLLVSRLGTRRGMVLGLLGVAASFALAGFVHDPLLLGGLLFLGGFCSALIQISQLTIMRHSMPDHVRGRALSLLGGNMRLAGVLAPLLGGVLVEASGYRAVFWARSALLLVACALFAWLGPRRQLQAGRAAEQGLAGVKRLVRDNRRILVSAGGTLLALAVLRASRRVLLPLWGHEMGLSPTVIGMVASAGAAADVVLFPVGGFISDKMGRKWSLTGALGVFSCGLVALAAFGGNLTGLLAVAVVIGMGNGIGSGINMTVGSDLAPKGHDAGLFLGIWRTITDTGGMLGPLAVGTLAGALALGPAAVVIGLAGLGSVAYMWRYMPESKGFRG
jgi:MFS family permease